MTRSGGFTVIELMVVIIVIGILTALAVSVPTYFQKAARDSERADDATSLARRLEQAYSAQETGSPSYPTTTRLLSDIASLSGTVARLNADTFKAPSASGNSVIAATSNSTVAPAGPNTPTLGQYVYQPLVASAATAAVCTGTSTCVRFIIYYRREADNSIQQLKSIHQQ